MASNPAQVILLLGLGLKDLSMTPSAIPAIRRLVQLCSNNYPLGKPKVLSLQCFLHG
jgi:phosphoenolpyruvate-protein kinase (PTS system EI component)